MDCHECGTGGTTFFVVGIADGSERGVSLCDSCRDDYHDGVLAYEFGNE